MIIREKLKVIFRLRHFCTFIVLSLCISSNGYGMERDSSNKSVDVNSLIDAVSTHDSEEF